MTASLLRHQYFNTLCNIIDKHTPIKKKEAPLHPDKDFMNTDILSEKHLKQKYEQVWAGTINQSRYRAAVNHYYFLLDLTVKMQALFYSHCWKQW